MLCACIEQIIVKAPHQMLLVPGIPEQCPHYVAEHCAVKLLCVTLTLTRPASAGSLSAWQRVACV